jgi:hypothetical protein
MGLSLCLPSIKRTRVIKTPERARIPFRPGLKIAAHEPPTCKESPSRYGNPESGLFPVFHVTQIMFNSRRAPRFYANIIPENNTLLTTTTIKKFPLSMGHPATPQARFVSGGDNNEKHHKASRVSSFYLGW